MYSKIITFLISFFGYFIMLRFSRQYMELFIILLIYLVAQMIDISWFLSQDNLVLLIFLIVQYYPFLQNRKQHYLVAQMIDISWFYQGLEAFCTTVSVNIATKILSLFLTHNIHSLNLIL